MDWTAQRTHARLAAWLNGIYAVVNMVGAVTVLGVFGGLGLFLAVVGVLTLQVPAVVVGLFFGGVGALLAGVAFAPFALNLLAAWALARRPDSSLATALSIVSAVATLPQMPIGTALGLYTLAVALWEPLAALERRGRTRALTA